MVTAVMKLKETCSSEEKINELEDILISKIKFRVKKKRNKLLEYQWAMGWHQVD